MNAQIKELANTQHREITYIAKEIMLPGSYSEVHTAIGKINFVSIAKLPTNPNNN